MTIPISYKNKTKSPDPEPIVSDLNLRKFVLTHVGRPDDLVKVDVKHLWGGSFRLNIYRDLRGRIRLTDSFFIQVVRDGITASPPLDRRYHDDILPQALA